MFTGIVREKGKILAKRQTEQGAEFEIACRQLLESLNLGDSISVDGVCLTVSGRGQDSFRVEVTPETLRRSNLGAWEEGDAVNLEPPARLMDFLGGHLVQGHVDDTACLASVRPDGNSKVLCVEAPTEVLRYCVLKGSITINGVSLTISGLNARFLEVTIIPHTLEVTNFGDLKPGDKMNVEVDVVSKYVESHVRNFLRNSTLLVLLLLPVSALAGGFTPGPKTFLVYESESGGRQYQLLLRLARFRPDIFLEWESGVGQGTVHLHRRAVESGEHFTVQKLFEGGVDVESAKVMTLWLSRRIYEELLQRGKKKIKLNGLSVRLQLVGERSYSVKVDQKDQEVTAIEVSDDLNGNWMFLKDAGNPLLLRYQGRYFEQRLKLVSTNSTQNLRWTPTIPPVK